MRIVSTNVLFQKPYEKYCKIQPIHIIEEEKRYMSFQTLMTMMEADIIAVQEICFKWIRRFQKSCPQYVFVGHNDPSHDGNGYFYNQNTIHLHGVLTSYAWSDEDRFDKRLMLQSFIEIESGKQYSILNCHMPFITNKKALEHTLWMMINLSDIRNITGSELLICGDFNQGYDMDQVLNEILNELNLKHIGEEPTCALSIKKYDLFDRIYFPKNKYYELTVYPPNKEDLLKHDYFDGEGENVGGDYYSDHSMLILDIV